jgi:hypothetical protein
MRLIKGLYIVIHRRRNISKKRCPETSPLAYDEKTTIYTKTAFRIKNKKNKPPLKGPLPIYKMIYILSLSS